jgi:pheromone shutdown protein TraB
MIGERDRFMAASINANAPKDAVIVMVVGIAHADGIERTLVSNKGWSLAPLCAPSNRISSKAAMQPVLN